MTSLVKQLDKKMSWTKLLKVADEAVEWVKTVIDAELLEALDQCDSSISNAINI